MEIGGCLFMFHSHDFWLWGSYFGSSFWDLQPCCLKIWNLKPVSFSGFKSKFHGFLPVYMTLPHYLTSEPGYLEYKINACKEFSTWGNSVSYDKVSWTWKALWQWSKTGTDRKRLCFHPWGVLKDSQELKMKQCTRGHRDDKEWRWED